MSENLVKFIKSPGVIRKLIVFILLIAKCIDILPGIALWSEVCSLIYV